MFHCPFCKTSAHSHTSRYLSDNVKQRYHQYMNIECSATFRTLESIDGVIRSPATEPDIPVPAPAATVNRAGA
ncbi:ogr/Delta-like zinc finger family protein [Atlantibacter hermannii]|uniref:ogr/Delta-like zinc finger family protein n=1 Tax=Atlantibacter hermannii TaxID=565 RepID=UPI002897BF28|nr:ogr/Delta-like zinc finger family protein [Atlantibacter hermannii]